MDIRFAGTRQRLPDTCQYFRVDERSTSITLSSDRTPVRRSSAHREMASFFLLEPDLFPPPLHSPALLLSLSSPVSPSIHPSILGPTSDMNLRSGFLSLIPARRCQWVREAARVIRVSLHGDRPPAPHADVQSSSLFRQSYGNGLRSPPLLSEELWRIHLWPLEDKVCFW